MPACIVATVADGRITRINEYLDPAGVAALLALTVLAADRRRSRPPLRRPARRSWPTERAGPSASASSTGSATRPPSGWPPRGGRGRRGGPGPAVDPRLRRGLRGAGQAGRGDRRASTPARPPTERAAMLAVAAPTLVLATPDLADGLAADARGRRARRAGHRTRRSSWPGCATATHGQVPRPARPRPRPAGRPSSSPRARRARPRGPMFGGPELAAVSPADVGDRWDGGARHAVGHAARPRRVHDQAALVPAHRLSTVHLLDRWRARDVLAPRRRRSTCPASAAWPRSWPCCCASPTSTTSTSRRSRPSSWAAPCRRRRWCARPAQRIGAAYSIRYSSTESGGVGTATAFDADDDEALFTVGRPRAGVERGDPRRRGPDRRHRARSARSACAPPPSCAATGATRRRPPPRCATAGCTPATWVASTRRGCLRLAGRAKEMFIRGGYNVYPLEVEAVLASHPDVVEVVVVPRPDPVMGEIGVAVVVPRAGIGGALPRRAAPLRARPGCRRHKLPEAIRRVDALPLTPDAEGRPPGPSWPATRRSRPSSTRVRWTWPR